MFIPLHFIKQLQFFIRHNKEMSGAVRSISLLVRRAASAPTSN
jgi:hypothetical protein